MNERKYIVGSVSSQSVKNGLLTLTGSEDIKYISSIEVTLPHVDRSQFDRTNDGGSRQVVVRSFGEISDEGKIIPKQHTLHRIHKAYTRDISKALVLDEFRAKYLASLLSLVLKDKSPTFIVHELTSDLDKNRKLTYF